MASIIERHDLLDSVRKDITDYQRNMKGTQGKIQTVPFKRFQLFQEYSMIAKSPYYER